MVCDNVPVAAFEVTDVTGVTGELARLTAKGGWRRTESLPEGRRYRTEGHDGAVAFADRLMLGSAERPFEFTTVNRGPSREST